MRDVKIPLFAGLLLMLLAGLAVFLSLQKPNELEPNSTDIAVDEDPFQQQDDNEPLQPEKSKPRETGPADDQATPTEIEPQKPVIKVRIRTRIQGTAVDFFDDPAEGITLTLLPADASEVTGPTTVTDEEGAFLFEAELNEGDQYLVACLQEDKALTTSQHFTAKKDVDTEGLRIKIFEPARVYGVVLQGNSGEPLEDVSIELSGRKDDTVTHLGRLLGRVKPSKSGPDGRFEVGHIAPGQYIISAVKKGWMAHPFNPITRSSQEVKLDEYANYELLPFILVEAGTIEGRVLKKSDKSPIAGATVELGTVLGGTYDTVVTDADGSYRFETVPPGMGGDEGPGAGVGGVAVRATAPGYAIATRDLRVRSGQARTGIDLLLDDGCSVTGIVTDNQSQPIAGARVYYNDTDFLRGGEMVAGIDIPERSVSTTTDDSGRFSLASLPPGNVTITASAEGYANRDQQVTLTVGTPAEVTIALDAAASITGVVTNERGEPIEGVPIAVYDATGPGQLGFIMKSFFGEELPDRGESTMFPASIRTDAEGRYLVEGLKPGKSILLANSRDYEKYASPELEVKSGETLEHNIVLLTGGTIFGRVYGEDNQPESGVPVTCASIAGQSEVRVRTAYTDRGGNYEITGLAAGTYTVLRNDGDLMRFMLPNPANQVNVGRGERVQFDIYSQKPGTARIYGRVTLDGQPYSEKGLVLLGGSYVGFAANNTTTDANGNYEFRSVPLGTYQIAQSQQGPMPSLVRKRVHVNKEGDVEINIDFVTISISGRVELEGGTVPEGNIRVLASPVNPDAADAGSSDENVNELEMMVFREVRADAETGAFEITGLSPGFYRLTVRSENNGMVTRPYLNARASVKGVVMTLPAVGATLKGVVQGLDEAEANTPFGLIAALTIEDDRGNPIALGGFDNGVNLTNSKEFTVANLGEGRFTITLSLTGYTPYTHKNVQLTAGETVTLQFVFASSGNARIVLGNEDINVSAAVELTFDIVNSKGEPFKKRFTFLDFFNTDGSASQNAEDNAFVIKDLPPETYTITLKLPGYKDVVETFTVTAGETVDVPVQFEAE